MNKDKFAKLIRQMRTEMEVTQTIVAKACGVSLTAYQRWEAGLSLPKNEHMEKLCDCLDIDCSTIISECEVK